MPRALRGRFEPPEHFVLGHLCDPLAFSARGSPLTAKRFIGLVRLPPLFSVRTNRAEVVAHYHAQQEHEAQDPRIIRDHCFWAPGTPTPTAKTNSSCALGASKQGFPWGPVLRPGPTH